MLRNECPYDVFKFVEVYKSLCVNFSFVNSFLVFIEFKSLSSCPYTKKPSKFFFFYRKCYLLIHFLHINTVIKFKIILIQNVFKITFKCYEDLGRYHLEFFIILKKEH